MYRGICKKVYTDHKITTMMNEMIDCLPKELQACTRMFYMEEKSHSQISEELGISLETTKKYLSKSKERLGEMILEYQKKGVQSYDFGQILLYWWLARNHSQSAE